MTSRATPIALQLSPAQLLLVWPRDRALTALFSGAPDAGTRWSRWTVLAEPAESLVLNHGDDVLGILNRKWGRCPSENLSPDGPPFTSGWIGYFSYQLGRQIEPLAAHRPAPADDRGWPLAVFHRCEAALAYDNHTRQWWLTGEPTAAQRLLDDTRALPPATPRAFSLGRFESRTGRDAYIASVRRAIEYIHAGDIFQANLAHRLTASFEGSGRALFARLCELARPWYGAYIECPSAPGEPLRAIASISPELFLSVDPRTRQVVTRPMKGTRRADKPGDLATSPKDIAELNMIIDLMRNDIGRVCELASVRVDEARVIERHAEGAGPARGVLQGVATVGGKLRPDASIADLLGATFPGGSVTGAPKIRAMQIIEELEPVARGPYCGAIGFVSDTGHTAFNIAIRTAMLSGPPAPGAGSTGPLDDFCAGSTLDYPVGAGIVADSDPQAEWEETLDKARMIMALQARD